MSALIGPTRVILIEITQPLPELRPDDHYGAVCVVACRGGVPQSMVVIDLTQSEGEIHRRLAELVARVEESSSTLTDLPQLPDSELPRISVVIPTIVSRVDDLEKCIEAIGNLDYPDFEVVIVDNRREIADEDPLPAMVQGRPWLRVVRETKPGISQARNAGLAHVDSEIIAYTDDDVRVDSQWLRAIGIRMSLEPQLAVVTGLVLPAELETVAQIWFENYYGGFAGPRSYAPVTISPARRWRGRMHGSRIVVRDSSGIAIRRLSLYGVGAYGAGTNMAFRRTTLLRTGGFNTALGTGTPSRGGEDLAVLINILWAGGQLGYEPAAFIHHRHRREYSELVSQLEGYGLGFTAMLTSLVWSNPRHLFCIITSLPLVLTAKVRELGQRMRGRRPGANPYSAQNDLYPKGLYRHETFAYLRGPRAYFRSRNLVRDVASQ